MQRLSRMLAIPDFKTAFFMLSLTLLFGVACSAGKPIPLPLQVKKISKIDVLARSNPEGEETTPAPLEAVGQALIALSALPSEQVGRLKTDSLADVSVKAKCGFVASQSELDEVLKDSTFTLEAPLVHYSSLAGASESLSFADCRCLVAESEKKLGIVLLPVSVF